MEKSKLIDLVEKSQNGDKSALNSLVNEIYNDLYYYILKTVKNENLAADITQESCIEIITTINKLQSPEAFSVWSKRIAFHQCTRYFRKNKEILVDENEDGETIFDELVDESEDALPEQVLEDKEFRKTIMDMINSLPSEQSNALLLYYYEKMSVKQIAEIQDTTEGTVKSRLNYARKAIKGKVEEYEERTGTKLHSVAILPLLLRFVFDSEQSTIPTLCVPAAVTATVGTTATTVASTTATIVAAKGAGTALATKIIAGVLAALLVIGGTVFGISKFSEKNNKRENDDSSYTEDIKSDIVVLTPENSNPYENAEFSKGLSFVKCEGGYAVNGIGECNDEIIIIPSEYEGQPVVAIEYGAFATRIDIRDRDTERDFEENPYINEKCASIKKVILPETIKTIGRYAFMKSSSIEYVYISDSVEQIEPYAFLGCSSLTEIYIPNNVEVIDKFTFADCENLKTVRLPETLKKIEYDAFENCVALNNINLHKDIQNIDWSAFEGCLAFETINLPENPAFELDFLAGFKNLKYIVIPDGVTELPEECFKECALLETVTLPESLKIINSQAFSGCTSLKTISLPKSLETIESDAFNYCTSLESIVLPESLKTIEVGTFYGCSSLKTINFPNSITEINSGAFLGCTSLTNVKLQIGVREINRDAFDASTVIAELTLPDRMTFLSDYGFLQLTPCKIQKLVIPKSIVVFYQYAFAGLNIDEFVYLGTTAEWDAIKKSEGWNEGAGNIVIHCTDGDITIQG